MPTRRSRTHGSSNPNDMPSSPPAPPFKVVTKLVGIRESTMSVPVFWVFATPEGTEHFTVVVPSPVKVGPLIVPGVALQALPTGDDGVLGTRFRFWSELNVIDSPPSVVSASTPMACQPVAALWLGARTLIL